MHIYVYIYIKIHTYTYVHLNKHIAHIYKHQKHIYVHVYIFGIGKNTLGPKQCTERTNKKKLTTPPLVCLSLFAFLQVALHHRGGGTGIDPEVLEETLRRLPPHVEAQAL